LLTVPQFIVYDCVSLRKKRALMLLFLSVLISNVLKHFYTFAHPVEMAPEALYFWFARLSLIRSGRVVSKFH